MDLSDLKDILRTLEEQDITEFELEQDGVKLRVCRASRREDPQRAPDLRHEAPRPAPADRSADPLRAESEGAATATPPAPSEGEGGGDRHAEVKSPIVGTFYRAPDPNSPPFVSIGDHVRVGQVLCIIEAMKLMNEIEADVAGEVMKIHPDNGQPVQYGEALFTIRPS